MFAVIKTGGKQYKVAKDDVLRVEKLPVEAGGTVNFQSVMMVGDGSSVSVGAPYVAGATVTAEVVEQTRGDKIIVFKKKRRKNYRRRRGHRQDLTVLRITEILTDGKAPSEAKAKPKAKKKAKPKDTASESKAAEPAKSDAEAAAAEAQATEAQASNPQASKPQAAESQATGDAAAETGDSKE